MPEEANNHRSRVALARVGIIVLVLGAWELFAFWNSTVNFAFGRPSLVWQELILLIRSGLLLKSALVTAYEVTVGFFIGSILGTVVGLALWFRPFIGEVWRPFVVVIASIPIVAFAPALIVIAGTGLALKILITAISTFFVVFAQSYNGAKSIRQEHLEFIIPGQVPQWTLFRLVVIPSALSFVLSSIRLAVGAAVLAAFIGEFISSDAGLGYLITRSAALYNIPRAMAGAFTLCLVALALDLLGGLLEQQRYRLTQWAAVSNLVR